MPITSWPYQEILGYPPLPYGRGFELARLSAPGCLPVTAAELCLHVKVNNPETDAPLLDLYLASAVKIAEEQFLRRQLIRCNFQLTIDRFPPYPVIELPRPPLVSLNSFLWMPQTANSESFAGEGTWNVMDPDAYWVDTQADPGRICLKQNLYWPSCARQPGAVQIQYTAGYGAAAASVPPDYRLGILHLAAHFYKNREPVAEVATSQVPLTIQALFGEKNHWL